MTPALDAALSYAERGWRVVPIIPGQKHPNIDEWQKQATTDAELIRDWWSKWPNHGVGIATGEASGIFVLDVDVSGNKQGDETLADLLAEYGPLPDTVEVVTGTNGRHIYFAQPPGLDIRNSAGAALGPGLDVRGEGGQVLAPPTLHPNGQPYEWEASSHPDDVKVADAPDWLIEILTRAPDPTEARREKAPRTEGEELPGDRFARIVDWPSLLQADGAVYLGSRKERTTGETYELWARPGVTDHTSATLYYKGSDVLKVFTSNWGGVNETTGEVWRLEEGATYTRFGYYAARHHNGNHSDAARAIVRQHGDPDMDAWLQEVMASSRTTPLTDTATAAKQEEEVDDQWEPPHSLRPPTPAPFPLHTLPRWMADYCVALAEQIQTPVDLCAQVALGAWSAACAGHVVVQISHAWRTHVNLYLCTSLHSGGGKSPVVAALNKPLHDLEDSLAAGAAPAIGRAQAERRLLEKEKTIAEKDGDRDRLAQIFTELDTTPVPVVPRLVADDSTPERLTELVHQHNGRFAVISSEGAVFDIASGMYRSSAKSKTNLDIYLKGWSGDRVVRDRTGSGDKSGSQVVIPEAVVTVAVTVQPSVISELRKNPELAGRGFTARFMYSVPEDMLGHRDHRRALQVDPTTSAQQYEQTFVSLATHMLGWQKCQVTLSSEALDAFLDWRQAHERHLAAGGPLEAMAEWMAKLHGTVPRVAALLHLADGRKLAEPVAVEEMQRAIDLGDYWVSHAHVVADMWSLDDTLSGARRALQRLVAREMTSFTEREAWLANRNSEYQRVEDFRPVLTLLCEYGWIRPVPTEQKTGRPSPRYVLHPDALAEGSARSARPLTVVDARSDEGSARSARDFVDTGVKVFHPYTDPRSLENPAQNAQKSESKRPPGWSLIGDPDDEGAA